MCFSTASISSVITISYLGVISVVYHYAKIRVLKDRNYIVIGPHVLALFYNITTLTCNFTYHFIENC